MRTHARQSSATLRAATAAAAAAAALILAAAACAAPPPRAPAPSPRTLPAPPRRIAPGEAQPIRQIRPGVLHGLLISGELVIAPDAAAATEKRSAALAVCLDPMGNAIGVLKRPSGVASFDQAAQAAVAAWRFQPYTDQGVATPACSVATFVHDPAAREPQAALPPKEIELPPSVDQPASLPADATLVPAHPGVAVVAVCRFTGLAEAPHATWLQSSGDAATDRALYERREVMPVDEAREGLPRCQVRGAVAPPVGAPPPQLAPPPNVAPVTLEHARLTGDRLIVPSDRLKNAIQQDGVAQLMVPVKVCIDRTGRVDKVEVLKPSGYLGYDLDLINAIARWTYRPMVVDGQPTPVCSAIQFIYRQK